MTTSRGRFITFEGGEGAGKSTQLRRLGGALAERGISYVATREPGGSPGAEEIRKLLVEGEPRRWSPLTETLLLFAARADHVERTIKPALIRGDCVLCDRFTDSTYAYQGAARGLARETIRRVEAIAVPGLKPDLTVVLDLPTQEGLKRAEARGGTESRFEKFDVDFHERLRRAFLDLARRSPERCIVVDAAGSADEVAERVWAAVAGRLALS